MAEILLELATEEEVEWLEYRLAYTNFEGDEDKVIEMYEKYLGYGREN